MDDHVGARASRPHRGWHKRGYLPHFDAGAVVQIVTFRLADSLPREYVRKAAAIASNKKEHFFLLDKFVDAGLGSCLLKCHANAAIVRDALEHSDGERYRLLAWVVMPNHVHAMIEQATGYPLGGIVHSWKSFTAHAINKVRGANGTIWSPDYFDRFVRDEDHYANAKHYIEHNPVKACLAAKPEEWHFSSATP